MLTIGELNQHYLFTGKVVQRISEAINLKLKTGEVEIFAEEMETLGESKIIPFQIAKDEDCNEALRLEYRFLDMRRKKLHGESNFKIQGYCTSS